MQKTGKHLSTTRKWKTPWMGILILSVMYAGVILLLYPTIADWVYQYNQSKIISDYGQKVKHVKPEAKVQIAMAKRYNQALRFGAQVKAYHRLPTGNGSINSKDLDYDHILRTDESGIMGRIRVKAADVDLPIYHGTSDEVLLKGIGHLEGTSLPVGGKGTHTVMTGHRGLAKALMFTNLDRVKVGDTFTFEIFDQVLTYRVKETKVVAPEDTESLKIDPKKDLATLITCTPLGINTHRILVTGERIIPTPSADLNNAGKPSELPRFPWWLVILLAVFLGMCYLVWRIGWEQSGSSSKPGGKPPKSAGSIPKSAGLEDGEAGLKTEQSGATGKPPDREAQ